MIAGRAAPGATIDLLRNGEPLARAVADTSGLFAIVPPPLGPGPHEITLQAIEPDGTRVRSGQSVTVVIADRRDKAPLVTVTTPDQPTVVLSRPEDTKPPGGAVPPAAGGQTNTAAAEPGAGGLPQTSAQPQPSAPAPRPPVRVAVVESEGEGRLFVSGQAAPGATVRLYLNDAFVAPGGTGPDGRLSFTIERGIRPGDYRVRLDDVDPVTGAVKSRAEVPFNVPPVVARAPAPVIASTMPAPQNPGNAATAPGAASPPSERVEPPRPTPIPERQPQTALGATTAGNQPSAAASQAAPTSPPASLPTRENTGAPPPASAGQPTATARVETRPPTPEARPQAPANAAPARSEPAGRTGTPPGTAAYTSATDPGQVIVPEVNTAIVARGDNLWRISKRVYGRGLRYTVIFDANTPQIRNPDLIYPGQVFVLPSAP